MDPMSLTICGLQAIHLYTQNKLPGMLYICLLMVDLTPSLS